MRVNIYYGGRGLIEDSTLFVINKLTEVLEELRVEVRCYKLYESKNEIAVLPNTLKEADGVILAASVEWFGIGGYLQLFLDSCWLYGDKQKITKLYMMPLVVSSTYGEKEAELNLVQAWELLGGKVCSGISTYVDAQTDFETSQNFSKLFERKAEELYRTINQKPVSLPTSNALWKHNLISPSPIELTPQESEQLSKYVSDDTYVKKQKEDIEELSELFKGMLESGDAKESGQEFLKNLRDNFQPTGDDYAATYIFRMTDMTKNLVIEVKNNRMKCYYGESETWDVTATTTKNVINRIVTGRSTFQGAFMTGEITAKGDFKMLRMLDQLFPFNVI